MRGAPQLALAIGTLPARVRGTPQLALALETLLARVRGTRQLALALETLPTRVRGTPQLALALETLLARVRGAPQLALSRLSMVPSRNPCSTPQTWLPTAREPSSRGSILIVARPHTTLSIVNKKSLRPTDAQRAHTKPSVHDGIRCSDGSTKFSVGSYTLPPQIVAITSAAHDGHQALLRGKPRKACPWAIEAARCVPREGTPSALWHHWSFLAGRSKPSSWAKKKLYSRVSIDRKSVFITNEQQARAQQSGVWVQNVLSWVRMREEQTETEQNNNEVSDTQQMGLGPAKKSHRMLLEDPGWLSAHVANVCPFSV